MILYIIKTNGGKQMAEKLTPKQVKEKMRKNKVWGGRKWTL